MSEVAFLEPIGADDKTENEPIEDVEGSNDPVI